MRGGKAPWKQAFELILCLGVVMLIAAAPGPALSGEGNKVYKLGHIKSFEPFTVAKEGHSEGLAIEILEKAFAAADLKVVFVGKPQDELPELMSAGGIDGAAFLGINPKRKETYDFSRPYLLTGGALFTKAPQPAASDLTRFAGKTVATPLKGPLAGFIRKKYPKVKVLTQVKDYRETLEAVLEGRADAAALNTQSGAVLAEKLFPGKFSLPERGFLEVPIGVGVPKGKLATLLTRFNEGLTKILSDGTYDRILEKWGVPGATKPR
jgi:ABC-type amino acid transport substrate-binding protein